MVTDDMSLATVDFFSKTGPYSFQRLFFAMDKFPPETTTIIMLSLVYCVLASVFYMSSQTWAGCYVDTSTLALMVCLHPLATALFSTLFFQRQATVALFVGGIIIAVAFFLEGQRIMNTNTIKRRLKWRQSWISWENTSERYAKEDCGNYTKGQRQERETGRHRRNRNRERHPKRYDGMDEGSPLFNPVSVPKDTDVSELLLDVEYDSGDCTTVKLGAHKSGNRSGNRHSSKKNGIRTAWNIRVKKPRTDEDSDGDENESLLPLVQ